MQALSGSPVQMVSPSGRVRRPESNRWLTSLVSRVLRREEAQERDENESGNDNEGHNNNDIRNENSNSTTISADTINTIAAMTSGLSSEENEGEDQEQGEGEEEVRDAPTTWFGSLFRRRERGAGKGKKRPTRRVVLSPHRSFCIHTQSTVRVIDMADKSASLEGIVYQVDEVKTPPVPCEGFQWNLGLIVG